MNRKEIGRGGRRRNGRRTLRLEPLETRHLLAVTLDPGTGVLEITGTRAADVISVELEGQDLVVDLNAHESVFAVGDVTGIAIDALGGKDRVKVENDVLVDVVIRGGAGRDFLVGGGGDDLIEGGAGKDKIRGQDGDDDLHGGDDKDRLFGGDGDDDLSGDGGKDKLYGEGGDDRLVGGGDKDKLRGGEGDDDLSGDAGRDKLFGDGGDDHLDGGDDHDKLWGGDGSDVLLGGAGKDQLFGEDGDDVLDGGDDRYQDKVDGGDGDDVINHEEHDKATDGYVVEWELEFEAALHAVGASTATGKAKFEVEQEDGGEREVQFRVEIQDAGPSTTYDVVLDGELVGSLTTDDQGYGSLKLSNDPDDLDEETLPETFPEVAEGSTVAVVDDLGDSILEGSFVVHDDD